MAKKYDSSFIKEMIDSISPLTKMEVTIKMQLAARIADLIVEKGWSKSEFAAKVGKQPSEISKWLSGTHNFTIDTLCEIAVTMDVELIELIQSKEKVWRQFVSISAEPASLPTQKTYKANVSNFIYKPLEMYSHSRAQKFIKR